MTLARARILKATELVVSATDVPTAIVFDENVRSSLAQRVAGLNREASAQAERILAEANAAADAIVSRARAEAAAVAQNAASEADSRAVAQVLAEHVPLRISDARRAERERDHTLGLAALLAERLVGEALTPARRRRRSARALSRAAKRSARQRSFAYRMAPLRASLASRSAARSSASFSRAFRH